MNRISVVGLAGFAAALLACAPAEPESEATGADAIVPADTTVTGDGSPDVVPAPAGTPGHPARGATSTPAQPSDIVGWDSAHVDRGPIIPLRPDTVYR